MPMKTLLSIRMHGAFDGRMLETFRGRLGMTKHGRLDDDWDQDFGRRELRLRDDGWVKLTLWRYDDDDWVVALTYERDPLPPEEVERLRRQILEAAAEVGATVTYQSTPVSDNDHTETYEGNAES
jgi:hypothetical protein